jgi:hypothetical protein
VRRAITPAIATTISIANADVSRPADACSDPEVARCAP